MDKEIEERLSALEKHLEELTGLCDKLEKDQIIQNDYFFNQIKEINKILKEEPKRRKKL